MDGLSFSEVLDALKNKGRCRRRGWNGKGIFIGLQVPDQNSKMTRSYVYIDTTGLDSDNPDAKKCVVPWILTQTDLLATDWELI